MKKEKDDKDEALDIATGKMNSVEEDKQNLLEKLRMYSATIKRFRTQMNDGSAVKEADDEPNKVKELKEALKAKNKKLNESEARGRKLAEELSKLENNKEVNKASLDEKYKKSNEKVVTKTKDLKSAEQKLKKSENQVKELLDIVNDKNKKIAELESSNTRLRLMKDQALEISDKTRKSSSTNAKADKDEEKEEPTDKSKKKVVKCRYENTGVCRRKSECQDVHPKKTCQPHSKLGSCPMESICEHRHPFGVCYDWEKYGSCFEGDSCRHRHPFDVAASAPSHFLGHGSPVGAGGPSQGQGQASQRSPGNRHHDMRGNRW